ncbi:unnamed protein product [Lupinus luteus]|uniref:Pentatricopeptide repeat-containing protein n=1 Tax=Lupinus luteus TaxID=3873 RepID=A0AAV1YFJ8_LUPLU
MEFDEYTYNLVLGAGARSSSPSTLWVGKQPHALIVKHGIESNIMVQTTKIHFMLTTRILYQLERVFDEMTERTSITWNAMIAGYYSVKEGSEEYAREALALFHEMLVDFILTKKIGIGQPKPIENAKILVANSAMGTYKVKIYGARDCVDSL